MKHFLREYHICKTTPGRLCIMLFYIFCGAWKLFDTSSELIFLAWVTINCLPQHITIIYLKRNMSQEMSCSEILNKRYYIIIISFFWRGWKFFISILSLWNESKRVWDENMSYNQKLKVYLLKFIVIKNDRFIRLQ